MMDPTRIEDLNRWLAGQGAAGRVEVREVVIEPDLFGQLPERLRAWGIADRPTVVVMDATPMRRGSADAKGEFLRIVEALRPGEVIQLGTPASPPHADLDLAKDLAGRLPPGGLVISFGSGTITDLAKHARFLADADVAASDRRTFLAVPTACTVTAFSSALAVLSVAGVKRTIPSRGPDATWVDLQLLADAPMDLTRAGVGDLMARGVAYADWYLSDRLGLDESYSEVPRLMLADHEARLGEIAAGLARREPPAFRMLMEALLLAGAAMSVVGQTTPISGWEHAMSHYLDLRNAAAGQPPQLHGLQVATATLVATRAYEDFLANAQPAELVAAAGADLAARAARDIDRHFAGFDASGAVRAELLRDYMPKADHWRAAGEALAKLSQEWNAGLAQEQLRGRLMPLDHLRRIAATLELPAPEEVLQSAAASSGPADAVRYAHLVRQRFTFGDLASALDWLTDERITRWLQAAQAP